MSDGIVQVPPDSTGKKIDNSELVVAPVATPQSPNTVERQRIVLADSDDPAGLVPVKRRQPSPVEAGMFVRVVPQDDGPPLTQDDALRRMIELLEELVVGQMPPGMRDALPAIFESSLVKVGGILAKPKFAFANIAASQTDSSIIAASGGRKFRVLAYRVLAGGTATNFTFNSQKGTSAGSAIAETLQCGANGGISVPFSPVGHFETNMSEGLTGTTGAGSTVGVGVVYVEVLPVALPPLN